MLLEGHFDRGSGWAERLLDGECRRTVRVAELRRLVNHVVKQKHKQRYFYPRGSEARGPRDRVDSADVYGEKNEKDGVERKLKQIDENYDLLEQDYNQLREDNDA